MQLQLGIQVIHRLSRLWEYPATVAGWKTYPTGMTWEERGYLCRAIRRMVWPLEVNPTNHVLEEHGRTRELISKTKGVGRLLEQAGIMKTSMRTVLRNQ